ncbi:hypothetical protein [Seonamhaeicola maritimus]|uniref:hypothetical protein n=1 Tax=Seonamhaeicola maritimus TaxID=2591822 RepID=UPI002494ECAC|nr:hypothetical protein [Seonamhaeicola maritimus]
MNNTTTLQRNLIIFGIPLMIVCLIVLIANSSIFQNNANAIAIGITFDLVLTVPLVYFLLIRKTNIPVTTVVPFLILGIVVCSIILPPENQYYLNLFKTWALPVIELSIVSYIVYSIRKAVKQFKLNKDQSFDFFTTLKTTCSEILPKGLVMPFVTEIAVFYYGFIYWKKRTLRENEFSYHKKSGTITLLIAIIFIVGIETVTVHVLLSKWSIIAAWIFTFLSIYSGIQIFGFLKSMLKRPISVEGNKVYLRYGIMSETTINIEDIVSVEITSKDFEKSKENRKLSILGELESNNMVIRLKNENTLTGLYGVKRTYKNLAIYVDDKLEFKNRIEGLVNQVI